MTITESYKIFSERYHKNDKNKKINDYISPKWCGIHTYFKNETDNNNIVNTNLTITPISNNKTNKANIDYKEQYSRIYDGHNIMWDDSKYNKSNIGDLFGFWFCNHGVYIHTIEDILSPSDRLESWSKNIGQNNRNVVILSNTNCFIEWIDWIEIGGPRRLMGTKAVKKNIDNILSYYNKYFSVRTF